MADQAPAYATHDTGDGFTVETNAATAAQLAETFAPPEAEAPEADTPSTDPPGKGEEADGKSGKDGNIDPEPDKLTPFRKGSKPRDDAFARMKQATDKLGEERRLREAAEARVRELEARDARPVEARPPAPAVAAQEAPKAGTPFPTYDAYLATHPDASWDAWNDAKIEHVTEQKLAARDAQQAEARLERAHATRVAAMATKYPDYPTVCDAANRALAAAGVRTLPDVLVRAIKQSDRSDDLMYFLGTHPEDAIHLARRFANRPVADADLVQDLLEAKFSASAAPTITGSASPSRSSAKPPINPVGGHASATPVSPDELEFGPEYVRRMNKIDREKGRL